MMDTTPSKLNLITPKLREFIQFLWGLSHQGQLDTFGFVGDDNMLTTLIEWKILEERESIAFFNYVERRFRFTMEWRRYLHANTADSAGE